MISSRKIAVTCLLFALLLLLAMPFLRAEEAPKTNNHYLNLTKQHFDLAVIQFEHKDVFGACSNLRISMGYARHMSDNKAHDHIVYLIGKKCDGSN